MWWCAQEHPSSWMNAPKGFLFVGSIAQKGPRLVWGMQLTSLCLSLIHYSMRWFVRHDAMWHQVLDDHADSGSGASPFRIRLLGLLQEAIGNQAVNLSQKTKNTTVTTDWFSIQVVIFLGLKGGRWRGRKRFLVEVMTIDFAYQLTPTDWKAFSQSDLCCAKERAKRNRTA